MEKMLDGLLDPTRWPEQIERVSLVQTHISWVLIGEDLVLKIKKPVNFGFLDFSTLEKRRHFCHKEVELNRRLSPQIYLGVVPIRMHEGKFWIDGRHGRIVEYAVKMRRIPEERIMKRLFTAGRLLKTDLERVARRIAGFHIHAPTSPHISSFGTAEGFKVNTDENFQQTAPYIGMTITEGQYRQLKMWTDAFFQERKHLFDRRVRDGRVRDCHGDLHMEHVCILDEIMIFDCIEFNDRFRFSDTLCDIAFLLMDLEYHGGWEEASLVWDTYAASMDEEEDAVPLLNFYKVYRAYVRGKVNSFQLDDPHIPPSQKEQITERARRYFHLAYGYVSNEG